VGIDGDLSIYNTSTNVIVKTLESGQDEAGVPGPIIAQAFSADDQYLAWAGSTLTITNTSSWEGVKTLNTAGHFYILFLFI
jgi:hypothetical protein